MIDRRAFLATAIGALALPVAVAQPQGRLWRLGFLGGNDQQGNSWLDPFRHGMRELGLAEGRDFVLEIRWARGDPERARVLATELAGLKVDLIITQGSEAAQAAKRAAPLLPIVFSGPSYPVEEGLVASFARPGGNLTGYTVAMSDTVSKHLQLLRDVMPALADVAVVWSPANPGHTFTYRDTQSIAASLRLKIQSIPMSGAGEVDRALADIARLTPGALILQPTASLAPEHVQRISDLAVKLRIPSITNFKSIARQGLLMSYGPDVSDAPRRVAGYVVRILKGARPADLPVERPTKFELAVNLKTAKAIGLTIPQSLLLRADEVIQ